MECMLLLSVDTRDSFNEHPCNEAWGASSLPSEQPLHPDNKAGCKYNTACMLVEGSPCLSEEDGRRFCSQAQSHSHLLRGSQPTTKGWRSLCVWKSAGVGWISSLTLLHLCVYLRPLVSIFCILVPGATLRAFKKQWKILENYFCFYRLS